jgi:hypothetical protein
MLILDAWIFDFRLGDGPEKISLSGLILSYYSSDLFACLLLPLAWGEAIAIPVRL